MRLRDSAPVETGGDAWALASGKAARNSSLQSERHCVGDRRRAHGIAPDRVIGLEIADERLDRRCDDRNAARHRLEHAEAEAFVHGRRRRARWRDGRGAACRRPRSRRSRCTDAAAGPIRARRRGEGLLIVAVIEEARASGDHQLRVGSNCDQLRKGFQNSERVLALLDAAYREEDRARAQPQGRGAVRARARPDSG